MRRVFVLLVSSSFLFASSGALAGESCGGSGASAAGHVFDKADANGDGALTRAEYDAAGFERFGLDFEAYDQNGDGRASASEYQAVFEQHHPPAGARSI